MKALLKFKLKQGTIITYNHDDAIEAQNKNTHKTRLEIVYGHQRGLIPLYVVITNSNWFSPHHCRYEWVLTTLKNNMIKRRDSLQVNSTSNKKT